MNDAVPASSPDPLVGKVVAAVRRLAEGNTSPGEYLTVTTAGRTDRAVTLLLDVELGWQGDGSTEASREHPTGSTRSGSEAEAHARLRETCERTIADPATLDALASSLRANPVREFRTREDGAKVRAVPEQFHWHERCGRCSGSGQHECNNVRCSRGWITCAVCNGDGKGPCLTCNRVGSVWVNIPKHHGDVSLTRVTCNACRGSGRNVYCRAGCSDGRVLCPTCRGNDYLPCSPCKGEGWFLHRSWAWITGTVRRRWQTGSGEPVAFVEAFRGVPLAEVPSGQGNVVGASVTSGAGSCGIRLDCRVPHVHAEFACADVSFSVDAIGRDGVIRQVPRFLDRLVAATVRTIIDTNSDPETVIATSRTTRVTADVLTAVSGRGAWEASAVARQYSGAVSEDLLEHLHRCISKAYHVLGRGPLRRTWLAGGALAAMTAAATPFLGSPAGLLTNGAGHLVGRVSPTALALVDWGLTLLPVAITATVATAAGRRAVRAVVGKGAVRSPRAGWLPWAATVAVLGAHAISLNALTGSPVGHHATSLAGIFAQQPAGPLSPSSKPALAPRPLPPESAMSGEPAVWRAQFHLAQLGFFSGAPDGSRVSPALGTARDAFARAVPDFSGREVRAQLLDLVEGAVREELRIVTPADATLARPLGNLARANLTRADLDLMAAAVGRAARRPGTEEVWRSADGHRGGRVVRAVDDGGRTGPGCARFQAEVEIAGAIERSKLQEACQSSGRWVPRD